MKQQRAFEKKPRDFDPQSGKAGILAQREKLSTLKKRYESFEIAIALRKNSLTTVAAADGAA